MHNILKVQILYYQHVPPTVLANFWWSDERGLTCDEPLVLASLCDEGISLPGGKIVYPKDGRAFFDALPFGFTGLERAQTPTVVEEQKGFPCPESNSV